MLDEAGLPRFDSTSYDQRTPGPVTSPSRTVIDLAEVLPIDELREAFARARERDLLDPDALRAARARVEWRPSLAMLDEVIAEFCE